MTHQREYPAAGEVYTDLTLPDGALGKHLRRDPAAAVFPSRYRTHAVLVSGTLLGRLWWPVGAPASVQCSAIVVPSTSTVYPSGGPYPDLRTALLAMLDTGDLSGPGLGFEPDTLTLTVVRRSATAERRRTWTVRGTCWETDDVLASVELVAEAEECGLGFGDDEEG